MAVDEDGVAETAARCLDQIAQRRVKRDVQLLDARDARGERQLVAIDLFAVGDDAGDGAEAAGDAHRLRVGEIGQRLGKQLGIELVRFAVNVEEGARKTRGDQRHARRCDRGEQIVDEAIFGFAKR